MPTLSFKRKDVPFLFGAKGEVAVDTGNLQLGRAIAEDTPAVLNVSFKAGGDTKVQLGQTDTIKIGVSTTANLSLVPVFSASSGAASKLLNTYGVSDFFKNGANADTVILVFELGGSADVAASGAFSYSALKTTVELDAGVDGAYAYARGLDKTLPIERLLPQFFSTMRLPDQGNRAPHPGEAISLRYGGYLKLSAEVSAGYRLAGTKSVSLGQMALSEKYDLSILGKVGLSAGVAGHFSILITAADGMEGWARVRVRRHRAKDVKVAADVNVGFKNQLDGLPSSADEFLGAALGVNAKNFLNVFQRARELSDFNTFKDKIDGLAKKYIEEFIGKSFDKLESAPEFAKFLNRVNQVVTSYEQVEDRAITLFDRYFDRLSTLTEFLDRIQNLESGALDKLRKDLNPELWSILSQLTDGDPLGFLLGQISIGGRKLDSLAELKKRATAALELVREDAHAEIRNLVGIAKQSFGIDRFFRELAKIDTVDELQALANDKIGMFVTRLVGRSLDSATNLKEAFREVQAVLNKIDNFKDKLYATFKEAVNSSYTVALHAEYSRASETASLIDVLINMADSRGAGLLAQAGKGDFEEIISLSDTDLVRLREGIFTHRTRRESAFRVNIVGWHLNYQYEGFDRVITEAEQRLVPSDQGITVLTTATLEIEQLRKRKDEEMHVNFLLRALGESAKVVKSDKRDSGYFIDALKSLTVRYQLNFTDEDTSEVELRDYIAFAKELGLDARGATLESLTPLLPRAANGGFGRINASYDVRFDQTALDALLAVKQVSKAAEAAIRKAMRQIVLSNYLKSSELHDVAFAYATAEVFEIFEEEGFATFIKPAQRVFPVRLPDIAVAAPQQVVLDHFELNLLQVLYSIENSMVDAIKNLYKLLNSGKAIDPGDFEKKLGDFGEAMKSFDKFDQTSNKNGIGASTIFVMFENLVRLASGASASNSLLRLKSTANDKEVEKLFLSDSAALASA